MISPWVVRIRIAAITAWVPPLVDAIFLTAACICFSFPGLRFWGCPVRGGASFSRTHTLTLPTSSSLLVFALVLAVGPHASSSLAFRTSLASWGSQFWFVPLGPDSLWVPPALPFLATQPHILSALPGPISFSRALDWIAFFTFWCDIAAPRISAIALLADACVGVPSILWCAYFCVWLGFFRYTTGWPFGVFWSVTAGSTGRPLGTLRLVSAEKL